MNTSKVIKAGLVATAIMSIVALMAPAMGMPKMDFGEMLGANNPMMAMPYAMGWVMHFVVGVILALVYASFFVQRLKGSFAVRGIIFAMIPFVIAQSVMMPMMGMGFFSGGNMMMIMGSLIGHIVFGAILGVIYKDGTQDNIKVLEE
jgi:hypothetical protein|tara:strand:+ start:241 stop:681 length:441 start_codon:yes stop_codon:yes gene_type:complete